MKHRPMTDTQKVSALYSKKDNTPIKYVCTTSIQTRGVPMDVFYRDTPHPEFGNKYFGIYRNSLGVYMIADADKVEDLKFGCIAGPSGWEYSSHVHDFKYVGESFIDGGRDYTRMGGASIPPVKTFVVRSGEFVSDIS